MSRIRVARPGDPFTVQEVYGSQMLPERVIIKPQCLEPVTHWFCIEHRVLLHGFDIVDHLRSGEHTLARFCTTHGHESLQEREVPDPAKEQRRRQIAAMSVDELRVALHEAWGIDVTQAGRGD